MRKHLWVGLLCLGLGLGSVVSATEFTWLDGVWPHERSDLPLWSKVKTGRLKNGFRYAILPNHFPKGQAVMLLNVQAGSLMEEAHERGIAHFCEHMAFNGSKHFPPNSLIPWFQAQGMSFGGDTNAYTDREETVYMLKLARVNAEATQNGLTILRDFADGLSFLEAEVNEERGIILAEKKVREREESLESDDWAAFLYPESRLAVPVIGYEEGIRTWTGADLKAFYTKWYRPERMVLVVAGDVDEKAVRTQIERTFKTMVSLKLLPFVERFGPELVPGFKIMTQQGQGAAVSIVYTQLFNPPHETDSVKARQERFMDGLANLIVTRRLQGYTEKEPLIWSRAAFSNGWRRGLTPATSFVVRTNEDHWETALGRLIAVIETLKTDGITQTEFNRLKEKLLAGYVAGVAQEATWDSDTLAMGFMRSITNDDVYTSAKTDLEIVEDFVKTLTVEDVNQSLKASLSSNIVRLGVRSPTLIDEKTVREAWERGLKDVANVRLPAVHFAQFPYLEPATPVAVPAYTTEKVKSALRDLTLYKTTLKNGIDVVVMPDAKDEGTVRASFLFGGGTRALTADNAVALRSALMMLRQTGVGRLTARETMDALRELGVSVSESLGTLSQTISGNSSPQMLGVLLEAMRTQFMDPTLHPVVQKRISHLLALNEARQGETVEQLMDADGTNFFKGEPLYEAGVTQSQFDRLTLDDMRVALSEARASGPRLLFISGNIEPEGALRAAASLMGTLPPANRTSVRFASKPHFPAGETRVEVAPGDHLGKSIVTVAFNFDVEGADGVSEERFIGRVLANLVRERLRQTVREGAQLVYSPSATFTVWPHDKGFGLFTLSGSTTLEQEPELIAAFNAITTTIREKGINRADFPRVLETLKRGYARGTGNPRTWHLMVLGDLESGRSIVADYEARAKWLWSLTPEKVDTVAKRVFSSPNATLIVRSHDSTGAGK